MYYNAEKADIRIRELRMAAMETQDAAAVKLGIGRSHLCQIEHGKKTPSIDLFIEIAEVYQVSLDYLLLGKESRISDKQLKQELHFLVSRMTELESLL